MRGATSQGKVLPTPPQFTSRLWAPRYLYNYQFSFSSFSKISQSYFRKTPKSSHYIMNRGALAIACQLRQHFIQKHLIQNCNRSQTFPSNSGNSLLLISPNTLFNFVSSYMYLLIQLQVRTCQALYDARHQIHVILPFLSRSTQVLSKNHSVLCLPIFVLMLTFRSPMSLLDRCHTKLNFCGQTN